MLTELSVYTGEGQGAFGHWQGVEGMGQCVSCYCYQMSSQNKGRKESKAFDGP